MAYYINNMTRLFVAAVFFILICLLSLAQGAPANDTLYLIAQGVLNGQLNPQLVSIAWDVERVNTPSRTVTTPVTLSSVPISYSLTNTFVDYDPVQSRLFWSTAGKLFYRDLGSQAKNNFLLKSVKPTDSIPFAVDDVTRLVYYAKANDSGAIYAVTMDGKSKTQIVNVEGHSVQEIRVDPEDGYIFWLSKISQLNGRYIYRCDISGGNVLRIVNGTSSLESFTLDRPRDALYYVEGDSIKKTTYTGTPVTSRNQSDLMTIQSAGDGILFGIKLNRTLIRVVMNMTGKAKRFDSPVDNTQVSNKGMDFYSPDVPPGSNKCKIHLCSHFCLPGPSQTFRCACPVDHILKNDNKTCELTCQDITAPDHSKIDCYRSTADIRLCNVTCDTDYIYHPRYTPPGPFECRSRVWYPQPNLQPCLAIERPSGVRIYGHLTYRWPSPCNLLEPIMNQIEVQIAILAMLEGPGGPLHDTCKKYICDAAQPPLMPLVLSCDGSKKLLTATGHVDIKKAMDATETLRLNDHLGATNAEVNPSQYNISVLGSVYILVNISFEKLGHRCSLISEDIGTGCVTCPAGTQFNSKRVCELCLIGSYSSKPMSSICSQCGPAKTTLREGATSSSECKEFCNPGLTFNNSTKSCEKCDVGYYQNKTSIAPCRHCGDAKTTYGKGSKKASDCLDLCRPGYFHQNNTKSCQPCAKNTHQNKNWSYSCRKCPNGMITESTGAKREAECYLLCKVGKFYDAKKSDCERCPANTYQDSDGTKSCIPCGDPLHSNPGSRSKSDCVYSNIIYGAVGGLGGILLIIILVVSIVVCKKKCRRPESVPLSGFANIDDPHVTPSEEPTYESIQPVETRSRRDGQGPFIGEPRAPTVPNQYMSPEEWRHNRRGEDNHSGVDDPYEELNEEQEDDYDKLRVDPDGPTWPAEDYGVEGGMGGPVDNYMEPSSTVRHDDIRLNTFDPRYF